MPEKNRGVWYKPKKTLANNQMLKTPKKKRPHLPNFLSLLRVNFSNIQSRSNEISHRTEELSLLSLSREC